MQSTEEYLMSSSNCLHKSTPAHRNAKTTSKVHVPLGVSCQAHLYPVERAPQEGLFPIRAPLGVAAGTVSVPPC